MVWEGRSRETPPYPDKTSFGGKRMYTGYYIQDNYIYGPQDSGRFYIQDGYIWGPRNGGRFYIQDKYIWGPVDGGRFYIEDGYIYGPSKDLPWMRVLS